MHTALYITQILLLVISFALLVKQRRELRDLRNHKLLVNVMRRDLEAALQELEKKPTDALEDADDIMAIVNAIQPRQD